jgi:pimeloyl-ACP methyl ester carboxylesterase
LALLLAVVGCALPGVGDAAAADSCRGVRHSCSHLTVQLDRTGAVPGTVRLHIERQRARKAARPPLFMIAGGPGQSATGAFSYLDGSDIIGTEARSRDVIVMDLRGTGHSGLLRCKALESHLFRGQAAAAAACAAQLGPSRAFYTTNDSADDIEAVRQALRVPKIALYGTSYGTLVALTYARRYPANVDRLVLDSVVGPAGVDPLYRSSMRAASRVVEEICSKRRCRGITRDPAGDLSRLAARLERRPIRGWFVDRRGKRRRMDMDAFGLFELLVAGDIDFASRSLVPGSIRNALRGDPAPLLRTYRYALASEASGLDRPRDFSAAAYAAALCEESSMPWAAVASPTERRTQAAAFVTAQPPGTFGPFGSRAVLGSDVLDLCERWPATGGSPPTGGPLPDVPALVLAGGADLRTPAEDAQAVAASLPRAQLRVVRNSGHSVVGTSFSGCVDKGLRRFLAGGVAGRCSGRRQSDPLPPPPISFRDLGFHRRIGPVRGRTATAVGWSVVDGFVGLGSAIFRQLSSGGLRGFPPTIRYGGLRGGSYAYSFLDDRLRLRRVSIVAGVRVSGTVRFEKRVAGRLRVSGRAAAEGWLRLRKDGHLVGRLGGRRVHVGLLPGESFIAAAAAKATSSQQARLARRLPRLR